MTICKQIYKELCLQKWRQIHTVLACFLGWEGIFICKLQFEFVATAALLAHIHVVRAELLPFSFDYGVKLCMQAASTAHSLLQYLYTLLYLQGVCVSAARAISQRTEREFGSSHQLFSARGINRSGPWGVSA